VAEGAVGTVLIVVDPSGFDLRAGIRERHDWRWGTRRGGARWRTRWGRFPWFPGRRPSFMGDSIGSSVPATVTSTWV